MQPARQEALEAIGKLPDDTDMDEIMYRLYVLDKVRKGQQAADQATSSAASTSSARLIHGDLVATGQD